MWMILDYRGGYLKYCGDIQYRGGEGGGYHDACGEYQQYRGEGSATHVESTHLGPYYMPCSASLKSDQNSKMADDEEDCSGEIYGWQKRRN